MKWEDSLDEIVSITVQLVNLKVEIIKNIILVNTYHKRLPTNSWKWFLQVTNFQGKRTSSEPKSFIIGMSLSKITIKFVRGGGIVRGRGAIGPLILPETKRERVYFCCHLHQIFGPSATSEFMTTFHKMRLGARIQVIRLSKNFTQYGFLKTGTYLFQILFKNLWQFQVLICFVGLFKLSRGEEVISPQDFA